MVKVPIEEPVQDLIYDTITGHIGHTSTSLKLLFMLATHSQSKMACTGTVGS